MLMEGTGKYFWLLFFVFLIVYIAVKVSLGFLFKRAKLESWKAYIPFYTTYVLVNLLGMPIKNFYLSLIPFFGLYYLYLIIGKFLAGFNQNPKGAIWYVVFPMYNFPKLAFKNPKFVLNEYDLTEEFIEMQNILFEKPKEALEDVALAEPQTENVYVESGVNEVETTSEPILVSSSVRNDFNEIKPVSNDSVFTNESLEPDKTFTTYVEAKPEEKNEEKPIITPAASGRPKMCPKCGARLSPDATTCFLCGTRL